MGMKTNLPHLPLAALTNQQYEYTKTGLVWWKPKRRKGAAIEYVRVPLANFNAKVIDGFYATDGRTGERVAMWKVEATVMSHQDHPLRGKRRTETAVVRAGRSFNGMRWLIEKFGLDFIVNAGCTRRAAEAIAMLSPFLNP
jgi:hypothetical protein